MTYRAIPFAMSDLATGRGLGLALVRPDAPNAARLPKLWRSRPHAARDHREAVAVSPLRSHRENDRR
jgi:hypothetical protein